MQMDWNLAAIIYNLFYVWYILWYYLYVSIIYLLLKYKLKTIEHFK